MGTCETSSHLCRLMAVALLAILGCQKPEAPADGGAGPQSTPPATPLIALHNAAEDEQFSDTEPISITYIHWNIIRVRLNLERMQSDGISTADVVNSFEDASENGPPPKQRKSPPEIELITHKDLDQCKTIIIRATPTGKIIRIEDIAELELMHAAM